MDSRGGHAAAGFGGLQVGCGLASRRWRLLRGDNGGVHAGVKAGLLVGAERVGRHGDDGNGAPQRVLAAANLARGVEVVHRGHLHVHEEGVELPGLHLRKRLKQRATVGIDGAAGAGAWRRR